MRVTVEFYARLREAAGTSGWTAETTAGATVADVWRASVERYPALAPLERGLSCAVNADFSRMTARLKEGDEVAFLPPVSGGERRNA
jgi:molybdopterin converting factor subunit 1